MRDLTKSTVSAGLAMSLFGVQTILNAFRPPAPAGANPVQQSLDAVTGAILGQSGQTMRDVFQAGDKIQREIVDMTFAFLTLATLRPGGASWTLSGMGQQTTGWLRSWMGNPSRRCSSCSGGRGTDRSWPGGQAGPQTAGTQPPSASNQGWGPMPDVG
jgi:hypothetical protein